MVLEKLNFPVLKECVLDFPCFAKSRTVASVFSLDDSVSAKSNRLGDCVTELKI